MRGHSLRLSLTSKQSEEEKMAQKTIAFQGKTTPVWLVRITGLYQLGNLEGVENQLRWAVEAEYPIMCGEEGEWVVADLTEGQPEKIIFDKLGGALTAGQTADMLMIAASYAPGDEPPCGL